MLMRNVSIILLILFPVISMAASKTTEVIDLLGVTTKRKHPILMGSGSVNIYSQLYLNQNDVESGLEGASYDF